MLMQLQHHTMTRQGQMASDLGQMERRLNAIDEQSIIDVVDFAGASWYDVSRCE
jgi:hypothetical protein